MPLCVWVGHHQTPGTLGIYEATSTPKQGSFKTAARQTTNSILVVSGYLALWVRLRLAPKRFLQVECHYLELSCSVAPFFPFFGGCPTKNGVLKEGFPFFPGSLNNRVSDAKGAQNRGVLEDHSLFKGTPVRFHVSWWQGNSLFGCPLCSLLSHVKVTLWEPQCGQETNSPVQLAQVFWNPTVDGPNILRQLIGGFIHPSRILCAFAVLPVAMNQN